MTEANLKDPRERHEKDTTITTRKVYMTQTQKPSEERRQPANPENLEAFPVNN